MKKVQFDLFPGGNYHCITMSYDDGRDFDRRLVDIFNANGLKGTFHLNSIRLDTPGCVTAGELADLYKGHEISCHMVTHPFPTDLPDAAIQAEITEDKRVLEQASGCVVRGMSWPYGNYDSRVIRLCRTAGMEYSRTTRATGGFDLPEDFMAWHPTCHHKGVDGILDAFYAGPRWPRMQLLYVWGHSYEFDNDGNWDLMEKFAAEAGGRPDTWYATNIEIVDYINALHSLRFAVDLDRVYNPSAIPVWFTVDGGKVCVGAGETVSL